MCNKQDTILIDVMTLAATSGHAVRKNNLISNSTVFVTTTPTVTVFWPTYGELQSFVHRALAFKETLGMECLNS